jgi:hypothetical protein
MTNTSHQQKTMQTLLAIAQTHNEVLTMLQRTFKYLPEPMLIEFIEKLQKHKNLMCSIEQLLMEGMNDGN